MTWSMMYGTMMGTGTSGKGIAEPSSRKVVSWQPNTKGPALVQG
jgi:hypothetical protein